MTVTGFWLVFAALSVAGMLSLAVLGMALLHAIQGPRQRACEVFARELAEKLEAMAGSGDEGSDYLSGYEPTAAGPEWFEGYAQAAEDLQEFLDANPVPFTHARSTPEECQS